MKSCENCRFSKMRKGQDTALQLVCAYELPRSEATVVPTQQGPAAMITTWWPQVGNTDWCGKHEVQLQ